MKAFHGSRNPIPNTVNPHRTINAPLRLFVCVRVPLFISSTTAGTCNDDSAAIASVSLSFVLIPYSCVCCNFFFCHCIVSSSCCCVLCCFSGRERRKESERKREKRFLGRHMRSRCYGVPPHCRALTLKKIKFPNN
jgi:hypothetical protein